MEIPYTVRPRPDTGLTNPKLGIWLFLASEVMLFGGLFAGYIFMRLGAEPWAWPHGWLNVPVGTFNTFILIFSSVTIILSWEALKMHKYKQYKMWLAATWICGLAFLGVKLGVEWPEKFHHFGAYVQKDSLHHYERYLGNEDQIALDGKPVLRPDGQPELGRISRNLSERRFIGGHLADSNSMKQASIPYVPPATLDAVIQSIKDKQDALARDEAKLKEFPAKGGTAEQDKARADLEKSISIARKTVASMKIRVEDRLGMTPADQEVLLARDQTPEKSAEARKAFLTKINTIHLHKLDAPNASPYDPDNDKAHFIPRPQVEVHDGVELNKAYLNPNFGALLPRLNTYLASYFMITGLHGAHVLGGCIVFIYFWLNIKGGSKLYHTNHQQLCNRIEVAGLFWHLVDLVWIFVFPIFYLL